MPTPFAKTSLSRRRRGHTFGTMCIPPHSIKDAQAKAFAASGLVKDARLNLALIPGTSFNPIGFAELPLFLTLAFVYRAQFEPKMLGPMFLIYLWKECIPMSVCLHRYFSHKGFKCGRVTQFMLYIGGCLASQVRKSTEAPIRHPEARRTPFPWPPRCRGGSTCDDRPGRFNRDAAARFGDRQRTRTHRTHTRVHPVATPRATRHHPRRTPPRWYRTRVRFLPRFFHHERKFLHTFWPFVFPRFRTSRLPLTPTPPFHAPPPLRVRLFGGRASTEGTTRTATRRKTRTRPSRSASCTRGWGGCTVGTGKARSEAGTTRSTCRTT